MQQGNNKYYVASDHLGTPLALFNSEGKLVKKVFRTPFGKVISDSNPDFFLPVDFQGGLRDPLTQLVHYGSRVYDPLCAQWLTPNWEDVPQLLKKPYNIHLYRFHGNDPINQANIERHLTELPEWLATFGFDISKMLQMPSEGEKSKTMTMSESLPVISGLSCTADVLREEFGQFSTVPRTGTRVYSSLLPSINSRLANLLSVVGDGVLISKNRNKAIVHVVNEASPILRDVITSVFNDTSMVNLYFSLHGQDSFYFVQESRDKVQEDWDQLQRLGTMFNVTMHPVDGGEAVTNKMGQVDLRVHSTSVILNIRYGTTLNEERQRLIRHARRRAVEEAWQQEVDLIRNGHRGSQEWSKQERDELLASGMVSRYYGTDIQDIEKYPQLADDPTNVVFRRESTRKRRVRSRRPK